MHIYVREHISEITTTLEIHFMKSGGFKPDNNNEGLNFRHSSLGQVENLGRKIILTPFIRRILLYVESLELNGWADPVTPA